MSQNFDEDSARREFQRSPGLQAEFGTLDVYLAYERGLSAGRIRPPIVGRTVTKVEPEPEPRREVDEESSPPAPRVSSAAQRRRRQEVDNRPAAQRQAVAPDLRGIWQAHGPQAGRIQGTSSMSRFKSFEEFEQHVASHSLEVATNVR